MLRELRSLVAVALLLGLLFATTVLSGQEPSIASAGALTILGKGGKAEGSCPLKHTDVATGISGFMARVVVTQDFENTSSEKIEAVYTFPLPQDAAVDEMTIQVGSRIVRGVIKKREEAAKIYQAAISKGQVAALLDQQRPNIFTQAVGNIPPQTAVRVTIAFLVRLKYEDGTYEFSFPTVVGPRYIPGAPTGAQSTGFSPDTTQVPDASKITPLMAPAGMRAGHDISIALMLDAGVPVYDMRSPTHEIDVERTGASSAFVRLRNMAEIPNKDFVFRYTVAGPQIVEGLLTHAAPVRSQTGQAQDKTNGFFSLIIQPPERFTNSDVTPKELVFVMDSSGSMSGFPIEKSKRLMLNALNGLYPGDTFNIIRFSGDTAILFHEPVNPTEDNLAKARKFIEGNYGGGGTEMMKAIRAALAPSDAQDHVRIVVFLTDGYVGNDMDIIGEIQKHPNARVFSYGIGSSVNRFLLDGMAKASRGEVEYVSAKMDEKEAQEAADRLYERLRAPLLTDISLDFGSLPVTDIYPKQIRDLFSARPVIITGRYTGPATGTLRLKAKRAGTVYSRDIPINLPSIEENNAALPKLWARDKIDDLMSQDWTGLQSGTMRSDVRDQITQLGLDFNLMTQFTSFVAVIEEAMTDDGQPKRVDVPVELPAGVRHEAQWSQQATQPATNAANMTQLAAVVPRGGGYTESITVEANALQVQSETNDVSQTVTDTQISQLSTNGRNLTQLTSLVPGAASQMPDFDVPVAQYQNRSVTFNGQRSDHNNWIIDGGEAYDRGGGGIMLVAPSQDAIQEFKVTTGNYSADLGNASGGIITMALKQGTTKYHGSGWEYNRNDAFNAFSWMSKNTTTPWDAQKSVMRYNTFGFNIGGPLNPRAKNQKTFFFYNMEWRRLKQGSTSNNRALTAAQQDFSAPTMDLSGLLASGKTIHMPASLSASEQQRWMNAYGLTTYTPGATIDAAAIPTALFTGNAGSNIARSFLSTGIFPRANFTTSTGQPSYYADASKRDIYREEALRIDRQFTDKWTVMGHLIWDSGMEHLATPLWGGATYPMIGTDAKVPSWSGVVSATWAVSPTLLNEVTFNTNGNNLSIDPAINANAGSNVAYTIFSGWTAPQFFSSVNKNDKMPSVNVGGGNSGTFGMNYDLGRYPWTNRWRSYQFKDNVSWSRGAHTFRFGGSFMWNKKNQYADANIGGNWGFGGAATDLGYLDFLLGYASSYGQPAYYDAVNIAAKTYGLYAIDDWKITRKLTLNLGVRWEGIPPAYDTNGRLSNFYPELWDPTQAATMLNPNSLDPNGPGFRHVSGIPLSSVNFYMNGIGIAGQNGVPKGMFDNTWKTFAPRVGFAYDMTGRGTVLRGGLGMSYERTAGNEQYNMVNNVPFSYNPSVGSILLSDPYTTWDTGLTSGSYAVAGITGATMKHDVPTSIQYSLGIQHDLGGKAVLTLSYVGNTAYHQTDTIEVNGLLPSDTTNRLLVCGSACGSGSNQSPNLYRPYLGWGNINLVENAANSHYNSLQLTAKTFSWHNMNLTGTWTWAHGFDLVDGELWNNLDNPYDKNYNWGTSGFDRRHVVNIIYVYSIPFFRRSNNKFAKTALSGWTLSGVTLFSSGNPLTIYNGQDNLGFGGGTNNHAFQVSKVSYPKLKDQWFSTSSFRQNDPTTQALAWGNSPRGSVIGPGRNNFNISLFKNFQLTERVGFEFRAESFNTFNHTQYTGVNTSVGDPTNFGKINAAADPRVLQFGARLSF